MALALPCAGVGEVETLPHPVGDGDAAELEVRRGVGEAQGLTEGVAEPLAWAVAWLVTVAGAVVAPAVNVDALEAVPELPRDALGVALGELLALAQAEMVNVGLLLPLAEVEREGERVLEMVTEEEQLIVGMEVEVEMWEGVGASEGEEVCIPLLGEAMGVPVAAGALGVPASKGALGVPAALAVKASVAAAQMVTEGERLIVGWEEVEVEAEGEPLAVGAREEEGERESERVPEMVAEEERLTVGVGVEVERREGVGAPEREGLRVRVTGTEPLAVGAQLPVRGRDPELLGEGGGLGETVALGVQEERGSARPVVGQEERQGQAMGLARPGVGPQKKPMGQSRQVAIEEAPVAAEKVPGGQAFCVALQEPAGQ